MVKSLLLNKRPSSC